MTRFASLMTVPTETRRLLRTRFARFLPSPHDAPYQPGQPSTLPDEDVLQIFLSLTIESASGVARARHIYTEAATETADAPKIDTLLAAEGCRVVWDRIFISFDTARAAQKADDVPAWFKSFLEQRYDDRYHAALATGGSRELREAVAAVNAGTLQPRNVLCQSPDWVAARLWDRALPEPSDAPRALRTWVDRRALLAYRSLIPSQIWDDIAAQTFRDAAIGTLETAYPLGWDTARGLFVRELAMARRQPQSSYEGFIAPVPETLVDRVLWLEQHTLEHAVWSARFAVEALSSLVHLLLADVAAADNAPAPHPLVRRLVNLALDRPDLLLSLVNQARADARLLADLLFCPETCTLACLLVAQWTVRHSAWDTELVRRDGEVAKETAFSDAVSILGSFLRQGAVPPAEAAALLTWIHASGKPGFIEDLSTETMRSSLRSELAGQPLDTLRALTAALATNMPASGLGTPLFAAALDVIDVGQLAADITPEPLVLAYIQSIKAGEYRLSAHRISKGAAASLFALATRTSRELYQQFLSPLDISTQVREAHASEEEKYSLLDTLARALRAHIRMLCRAMAGYGDAIPDDLRDTLIATVRAGAIDCAERSQICVFAARFEVSPFGGTTDRPIAVDLSAALQALNGENQRLLLTAILATNEPLVLAQLLSTAPHDTRAHIKERLNVLTPTDANAIRSLTEVQARIQALLSSGATDAAARFIEAEHTVTTFGKVPGRELARLGTSLQLQLLREDWDSLAKAVISPDIAPSEQASARDIVQFYQAVAEVRKPSGSLERAETLFASLQTRHSYVAAYATNLFATRLNRLQSSNAFALIRGESLRQGLTILADGEDMMANIRGAGPSESDIFTCNKAQLLLALGQPERAYELLEPIYTARPRDSVAAYCAVALSRMGRSTEALGVLGHAEQMFGTTDVVRAARSLLHGDSTAVARINLITDTKNIAAIKQALFDLSQLDHISQTSVFKPPPESFEAWVIEQVRSAAASVVSLVPMMKVIVLDECEDNLSALIRELLTGRLAFIGWSIVDQTKGGFTSKGNPGERDLVIKRQETELTVIESVVCGRPVDRAWENGKRHFRKLFSYSSCHLFFHLTYAYVANIVSLIATLKVISEHDAPAGFEFSGSEDIPHTDSRPHGFMARYNSQLGEVKVVFLVLDLEQSAQKTAAKVAGP